MADTWGGSPWIKRMAFTAQAPNLPGRMNKDGFVMVGSLTCPQRSWIGFLFGLPNRRGGLAALRRRFLPTVGCPSAVAVLSYFGRSEPQLVSCLPSDLCSRTGDLHPTSHSPCQAYRSDQLDPQSVVVQSVGVLIGCPLLISGKLPGTFGLDRYLRCCRLIYRRNGLSR